MQYIAIVDDIDPNGPASCGDCDWEGTVAEVLEIGECILTPGDPSPVGRCPECETLAYNCKRSEIS